VSEESEPRRCDCATLEFPSDAITLGRMRRKEPYLFSLAALDRVGLANIDVASVLRREIMIAEKSFDKALRRPDPFPDGSSHRDVLIEDLKEAYQEYGLASGDKSALELIRRLEAAAAAQAVEWQGRGR
jgi:hypothetical protein